MGNHVGSGQQGGGRVAGGTMMAAGSGPSYQMGFSVWMDMAKVKTEECEICKGWTSLVFYFYGLGGMQWFVFKAVGSTCKWRGKGSRFWIAPVDCLPLEH